MKRIDDWPIVSRASSDAWRIAPEHDEDFIVRKAGPDDADVIYLVQGVKGGPVKIGVSSQSSLQARIKSLQVGNPEPLELRRLLAGTMAEEQALHIAFSRARIRGEWFFPSEPLRRLMGSKRQIHDPLERSYQDGFDKGIALGKEAGWADGWSAAQRVVGTALGLSRDLPQGLPEDPE